MSKKSTEIESESRRRVRHGRHSRHQKKKKFPVLIGLIIILILGAAGYVLGRRYLPSRERADLDSLYGAPEGYASLLVNHEWSEYQALLMDGEAYVDYDAVRLELNGRFFWDSSTKTLLYTMPEEIMTATAATTYEDHPVFVEQDEKVYLYLPYVMAYTNVTVETYSSPDRLVLRSEFGEESQASVKSNSKVRVKGGIKSPIITTVSSGDTVTIIEEFDSWTEVQTSDGWLGYVQKSDLNEAQSVIIDSPDVEPEYTNISLDHTICMVWQQSLNSSCLAQLETLLTEEAMDSVNTVSPTWFTVASDTGEVTSRHNPEYTALAHENNLDVWPVLENVNAPEVDMTTLLSSTANRRNLIDAVMAVLEETEADGLNVDLEDLPQAAADGYIQLIRELSIECRTRGLVLSVDVPAYSTWTTAYYNREEQGIVADYVIIMGYDEHYNGSEEAGSTASLPYVQESIENTIAEVPVEKVINGVPFYSRLWKTASSGNIESEAIGMDGIQEFISKYGASSVWNDELAQNYVKVEDGTMTYEIWIEDVESMEARLAMMQDYELAGISCWKQGMESQDVWDVFREYYAK